MNATRVLALSCGVAILGLTFAYGQKAPQVKSKKEAEAFQAVQAANAAGPEATMKAIDDFLIKFADSDFKVLLLEQAMMMAQQKRDSPAAITYAQRVIEADPKSFEAYVTMATETANNAKEFDLDKAEKTANVQKWAQTALENLKDHPKPYPQLPDEQWTTQKKGAAAQAHAAIATMALANKKYDDAVAEYKTALDASPDAVTMFRLGETYMKAKQYDEAATTFDKVLGDPSAPASVKTYATQRKADVAKLKAAAAK